MWYIAPACWLHTRSSSALSAIRTVYASIVMTLQISHLEEMESYDQKKEGLKHIYTLLETQPITRDISHGQSQFPTLSWCHSVMNLVKGAVEHPNPNQTPVLTMDQPLSTIQPTRYNDCGLTRLVISKWSWLRGWWGWGGGAHVELTGEWLEWNLKKKKMTASVLKQDQNTWKIQKERLFIMTQTHS